MDDVAKDDARVALLFLKPKGLCRIIRLYSIDDKLRKQNFKNIVDFLVLYIELILLNEVLHLPSLKIVLLENDFDKIGYYNEWLHQRSKVTRYL